MFLESQINHPMQKGSIEIICGSMFSGKTEELLRRLKRAQFANLSLAVFKPKIDVRYGQKNIVSHNKNTITATTIDCSSQIPDLAKEAQVIAIDEAQFFDTELIDVCNQRANEGKRIIIAGLDMDFLGKPFGIMPKMLAIAEHVTKLHAICLNCGSIANHSFRIAKNKDLVQIGEKNEYKPLCRVCFSKEM